MTDDEITKVIDDAIQSGNFYVGFSTEKYAILPFYVYLEHNTTNKHIYMEIDEQYVVNSFNSKKVSKEKILADLNKKNYRVIIESRKKSDVTDEIKRRYKRLIRDQQEIRDINDLFDNNPEFAI